MDKARFQLAHLNYALLHGMAVVILLLHDTAGRKLGASACGPAPKGPRDPDVQWSQPGIVVNAEVSGRELGPIRKCPLLHVRFHWQDRPGAFLDVLESIDAALADGPPAFHRTSRSVSYARLSIATGRTADGDLTVRLHDTVPSDGHGNLLPTGQLARKISAAALHASAGRHGRVAGRSYPDGQQNPVVRVDLLGRA